VQYKIGDDPVTAADKEANALIVGALRAAYPGVPVVAEESDAADFAGFHEAPAAWFVDPIDGTRDFVAQSNEFCVMIGLAEGGSASVGAIVCPATSRAFVGVVGMGAWEILGDGTRVPIHVTGHTALDQARCVVSKSHRTEEVDRALRALGCKELVPCGSVGVKALRVATGEADLYVHPAHGGMRWDSCAPEAIVWAAAGVMLTAKGHPIDYASRDIANHHGLIAGNEGLSRAAVRALGANVR
jgi:3'(2'), 5'-bisphosphate nucleotidase